MYDWKLFEGNILLTEMNSDLYWTSQMTTEI